MLGLWIKKGGKVVGGWDLRYQRILLSLFSERERISADGELEEEEEGDVHEWGIM